MASNSDSVFFPTYFFDAFNKATRNTKDEKVIPIKNSPLLNSNSYNGFENDKKNAWNFQLDGEYTEYYEKETERPAKTTNPHFLKIFHDGSNIDVVQAGAFSCRKGRNLNVGYVKNVSKKNKQYIAGIFNDNVEKNIYYKSFRGSYEKVYKNVKQNDEKHKRSGIEFSVYTSRKGYPYPLFSNDNSKHNEAVSKSVYYNHATRKFETQNNYILGHDDLKDCKLVSKNYPDIAENNDCKVEKGNNYYKLLQEEIVDKNGIAYFKVAAVNGEYGKNNTNALQDVTKYIVMTKDKKNPRYMVAELINREPRVFNVKEISFEKPICVKKENIFTSINNKKKLTNYSSTKIIGDQGSNNGYIEGDNNCAFYYSDKRFDCKIDDNLLKQDEIEKATIEDITSEKATLRPIGNHNNSKNIKKGKIKKHSKTTSPKFDLDSLLNTVIFK